MAVWHYLVGQLLVLIFLYFLIKNQYAERRERLYVENSLNMVVSPRNIAILNNTVQQFLDTCQVDWLALHIKRCNIESVYLNYQPNDFYMNFCLEGRVEAAAVLRVERVRCQLLLNKVCLRGKAFEN